MKVIPNLFIVGAAKSGSTSLYHYLNQHKDIYFSPIKEPNYFSADIDINKFTRTYKNNTFLDVEKYFKQNKLTELPLTFLRKEQHYQKLFENGKDYKIIGEASTSYLYSKTAAENIYKFNPESKIMAILRNPATRAFSHYLMAVRYGFTKLDFKNAILEDLSKKEKGWGISELFIELGMYNEQLERYYEVFPGNQIKVLYFDDLKTNIQELIDNTCTFLEIAKLELGNTDAHNVKETAVNYKLNYLVTQTGTKNLLRKVLSKKIRDNISKSFYKQSKIKMTKEEYSFILDFYREDISKTASLLNVDLSHWLDYDNL